MAIETETKTESAPSSAAAPQPTALAVRIPPNVASALVPSTGKFEPRDMTEAMNLAATMAEVFKQPPGECLAKIMMGESLGIRSIPALQKMYFVDNKLGLEYVLMLAICLASPICEAFAPVKSSRESVTWKAKRRGHEEVHLTWTAKDAEDSLLMNRGKDEDAKAKSNWNRFTEDMLTARVVSRLARRVFPDLILGIPSADDLEDERELRKIEATAIEAPHDDAPPAAVQNVTSSRDWAKETATFKERIEVAKTLDDPKEAVGIMTELRDALKEHEANPHLADMKKAWNDATKEIKKKAAAPAEKKDESK